MNTQAVMILSLASGSYFNILFQALTCLRYICYGGLALSLTILIKLLSIGRKLNFINVMFVTVFTAEVILGAIMIPNFFDLGERNLLFDPEPKNVISLCGTW